MRAVIKGQIATLFALLTALVVTLAACGGGSSSSSGGGAGSGGATIAGTVSDGAASIRPDGGNRPLVAALVDVLVEPAHAAPMAGVPVTLVGPGGTQTTTTDSEGRFEFTVQQTNAVYTVKVLGTDIQVQVGGSGSESEAEVEITNGGVVSVEVEVEGNTISGKVEDDASSDDDDSSGDGASVDNDSADHNSIDDDSADQDSVDDDSEGTTT